MEVFGIIGMSLGVMGFIFGLIAYSRIDALEKKLKENGVLDEKFDSEK